MVTTPGGFAAPGGAPTPPSSPGVESGSAGARRAVSAGSAGGRRGVADAAFDVAAATPDPELPMVTIAELGILRAVDEHDGRVVATITPTYSGCPAMPEIAQDVRRRLERAGFADVTVRTALHPPWSSDWITDDGRRKLAGAGIAPPHSAPTRGETTPLQLRPTRRAVACPQCGSTLTVRTADFAATACRALYRCDACREPFEYVKEL
jgi:ring-1,2-phenylacetyl-CoA epoxidase subunit PaaD